MAAASASISFSKLKFLPVRQDASSQFLLAIIILISAQNLVQATAAAADAAEATEEAAVSYIESKTGMGAGAAGPSQADEATATQPR